MLKVNQIHSFYGKSHILHGLSLKVNRGEIVTLLGRNGVGKTTTLKSIMGLVVVQSGNILYQDESILGKKSHEIFRKGLGYVPQGRRIFGTLNVAENLKLAHGKKDDNRVNWILEIFPALKMRLHHDGSQLSGGEQQMLAIARVLLGEPQMILLDEPSEGLAPIMTKTILKALSELTGITALLVEANLSIAIKLGDRHYIMDQGAVVEEVSTRSLSEDENLLNRYFRI